MALEDAQFQRIASKLFAKNKQARIMHEQTKGCSNIIYPNPVMPEPAFTSDFVDADDRLSQRPMHVDDAKPPAADEYTRLKIWVNPQQSFDWNRAELMVKQLSFLRHRTAMEIVGNCKKIAIQLMCHKDDVIAVRTAFKGQFEHCLLTVSDNSILTGIEPKQWKNMSFWDFYPMPPYSDLFSDYEQLQRSPYTTLINALADLPATVTGLYQFVFKPTDIDHNWHKNVKQMLDIQYKIISYDSTPDVPRYAEQAPSASLTGVAKKLEEKCHNDKPFFAGAVRFAILDEDNKADDHILKVAEMAALFLHGGNLMRALTDKHYRKVISEKDFRKMFLTGRLYRPGFILNSKELTGFSHIPPYEITEHIKDILKPLEILPPDESLSEGVKLGYCEYADKELPVCIPEMTRFQHTHLIGTTGTGKTHLLKHIFKADILAGHGAAVIDPHGQLIQDLLDIIPASLAEKVIYFNPGDPKYIPMWNPLNCGDIEMDKLAVDITDSFKSFMTGWGHRLEHILRQAVLGVLHLPGGSFYDVSNILRRNSRESKELIEHIKDCTENPSIKNFWEYDFKDYSPGDIQPVHHKLSALMTTLTVGLMLSQKVSSFKLNDVVEKGMILLVDLSEVGIEVKRALGCFMLSLLNSTAMSRDYKNNYENLNPFHIHCDEAHMFVTDALEGIIAQVRKAKVSLTLAHQYLRQFDREKIGALTGVGSRVVFSVNDGDAATLKKAMLGKAKADDLVDLKIGQAVARINNKVTRFETEEDIKKPKVSSKNAIIENSRNLYYVPIEKAKKEVFARQGYQRPKFDIDLSDTKLEEHDEFQ